MEMNDTLICDYIKTRWIDLYQQLTQETNQIFIFYVPFVTNVWLIGEMKNKIFWPTNINLSPAEEKWLEGEVVKKGFESFTQTGLYPYYTVSRMRKNELSG